jgi:hypothetical protein
MAATERKKIYEAIEEKRKRPLIAYVTTGRPGVKGDMAQDALREFADQLAKLPKGTTQLDVLINSYGGDGLMSWRLVSLLREYLGKKASLSCLVPYYAFSAATLFAVGCDQIIMHPLSCLGPVDPQMHIPRKDGPQDFAYEDVSAFTRFIKEEAGITEQTQKTELIAQLVKQIDPSNIGAAKRASMQSRSMAEKLLGLHMKGEKAQEAAQIAEKLSKNYFSHGHALGRSEAIELGLKVATPDEDLEDMIWRIFTDFEQEMEMCKPFDATRTYLSHPDSAGLLAPPPQVNLPSDMPPAIMEQTWKHILQQIKPTQGPVIDFKLIHVAVESARIGSRFVTRGKIYGARGPDLDFSIGTPRLSMGWEPVS